MLGPKTPKLEALTERIFPGMGWRPLWLSVVSAVCLTVYHFHGRWSAAPDWFLNFSVSLTGIRVERFHQAGWSHLLALVLLMAIPLLIAWFAEGWKPQDLGLSIRGAGSEFALCFGLWVAMLPLVWLASGTPSFQRTYPLLKAAETSAFLFGGYHAYYLLKWVAWEFFFRGFMLFGFKHDMGSRAVLVSTLPFVIIHMNKPEAEMLGSIAAGLVLCWIALRSKSIWPGVMIHWLVAMSMDFFASTWWH